MEESWVEEREHPPSDCEVLDTETACEEALSRL